MGNLTRNEILTQEDILRYLSLVDRRLSIIMLGVEWRPEHGQELEEIDQELASLRKKVDAAHAERGKPK